MPSGRPAPAEPATTAAGDEQECGGGVAGVAGVAELANHVGAAFERVGFLPADGVSLNEEVADGGEGVAAT